MTIDSLKRTSATLVSLRKFQLRSSIDEPTSLYSRARLLVRPLIEEFNQHPVLTYQRIKSYLDELDGEYIHIRSLSLMLVIGKAHQFSDTALEPVLAALTCAQRILQFKAQRASTKLTLPVWISKLNSVSDHDSTDLFTQTLKTSLNQPQHQNLYKPMGQIGFSHTIGLQIARYIAEEFEQAKSAGLIELTTVSQLLEQAPWLNPILSQLVLPTSAFWSRTVLHHQDTTGFLLYANANELKIATKTKSDSGQHAIIIESAAYQTLYSSALGRSQVSFKIWLKALFNFQQSHKPNKHEMALPEYPIQRPPHNLLNVVHALHKPTSEPSTIAALISKSSLFSQTLQRSAQQLNRMSIPVNDVKQSILTHGMERIGIILTEQVLWSRLTHANFPLKQQFEKLVELHRFTSASISHINKEGLPQHASLLATLQLSFLFTHAPLRVLTSWQDADPNNQTTGSLIIDLDTDLPVNSALTLAKAWHQPVDIIKPLRHFNKGSNDRTVEYDISLLKASLFLSRQWMSGNDLSEIELNAVSKQYAQLKLSAEQLITIRANASEFLQCPLR